MKRLLRILKRILVGLGVLLLLGLGFVVVKFYILLPKVRPAQNLTAPKTPEAIERGRYLAENVCGCITCHSKVVEGKPGPELVEGFKGAGRDYEPDMGPKNKGLRSKNLTPDKESGLGAWTDGEIVRAFREGISRDGRVIIPLMPYDKFAKTLSDDDALAIVAYLRSLPPVANPMPMEWKGSIVAKTVFRAFPAPVEHPVPNPPTDPLARGNWLLHAAQCHACHDITDAMLNPLPGKELGGGFCFPGKMKACAANISSDKATGIGAYTDEEILRAITEGKSKTGRLLQVMPWTNFRGLSEEDKRAMLTALRATPPVVNIVTQPAPGP